MGNFFYLITPYLMGLYLMAASHGADNKEQELLLILMGTVWIIFGLLRDEIRGVKKDDRRNQRH